MLIQTINALLTVLVLLAAAGLAVGRLLLPDRLWLALYVCAFLGPLGHFYIKGGFSYALLIVLVGLLLSVLGLCENTIFLLTAIASPLLMLCRFKMVAIHAVEQKPGKIRNASPIND